MRPFYLGCLSLFIITFNLNGQDSTFIKTNFKGDLYDYFGSRLTYPMDLAFKGISGFAEVEFRVNNFGKIDSVEIITVPDIKLADEISKALVSTKDMWTPTRLNNNTVNYKYKLIVEYKIIQGSDVPRDESAILKDKAEKKMKKEKYDEALELIDKAITLYPYGYLYYDLRSRIFHKLGDIAGEGKDKETSNKLEKQIVGRIVIIAYGIVK